MDDQDTITTSHGGSDPRRRRRVLWLALLVLFLGLRLPPLVGWAPTWDEPIYVGAGKHWVTERDPRHAALLYHPPLSYYVTSLPLWLTTQPDRAWDSTGPSTQAGLDALYESRAVWEEADDPPLSPRTVLILSRLPMLLLGLLGAELIRRLGTRLVDERAGWIAAFAWTVHPDVVAQGVQATTDLPAAVASVALVLAAVRHFAPKLRTEQRTGRTLAVLGAVAGLALLTKHSLLFVVAAVAVYGVFRRVLLWRRGEEHPPGPFRRFAFAALIAGAVLWSGYLFEARPLATTTVRPHAQSAAIARVTGLSVDQADDILESVPVPAATYVVSVADALLEKARARENTQWVAYLDGEWRAEGFLSYFPVAFWVKTPLALVLLTLGGLGGWWFIRPRARVAADLTLFVFALVWAAAITSRLNIGIRHLLPAVPLGLVLGAGALSTLWNSRPRAAQALVGLGALLLVIDWVPNLGEPLSFAQVAGGGPTRVHERLADSNLEMGQDLWRVEHWADARNVEHLELFLHGPPGITGRETARASWVTAASDTRPRLVQRVRDAHSDTGPLKRVLAIGESQLVRKRYAELLDLQPVAVIGRTWIFRLPAR